MRIGDLAFPAAVHIAAFALAISASPAFNSTPTASQNPNSDASNTALPFPQPRSRNVYSSIRCRSPMPRQREIAALNPDGGTPAYPAIKRSWRCPTPSSDPGTRPPVSVPCSRSNGCTSTLCLRSPRPRLIHADRIVPTTPRCASDHLTLFTRCVMRRPIPGFTRCFKPAPPDIHS